MKTFFAVLALLASVVASDGVTLKIYKESTAYHHQEGVVRQDMLAKKQDMFYRMAHMKSTPWDAQPTEKATKCEDICLLQDFWMFQQQRNCVNRPTSLCSAYKMGLSSMDVVLTLAECDCGSNSTSTSGSAGNAGDQ